MNTIVNTSPQKSMPVWSRPETSPDPSLANRTAEDIAQWDALAEQVVSVGSSNGWSKAEVSRRIGMPEGTFSQWFSGTYVGQLKNQNDKVARWLEAVRETASLTASIPQRPPFQRTRIANEIMDTLALAQATGDLVMITVDAGNGKTETCRHYHTTRPHVYLVTASPHTRSVKAYWLKWRLSLRSWNTIRLSCPVPLARSWSVSAAELY